jgi:hypothetical protein
MEKKSIEATPLFYSLRKELGSDFKFYIYGQIHAFNFLPVIGPLLKQRYTLNAIDLL